MPTATLAPTADLAEVMPFRRDIALAESKLIDLGYDDETTALIIADIRRCGSAWCSTHFDDSAEIEHAEIIEAILGDHPDWNSPGWDADCWETDSII